MNTSKITTSLSTLFDQHRIVFWFDPEGEFTQFLGELQLPDVTVLRRDEMPALELKILLELDDPQGKYLVYAPSPEPEQQRDWLLNIRLYSYTFHADKASIILGELGLLRQSLRLHIADRAAFFRSKERLEKLRSLVAPDDDERSLDLKMLAVLTRAEQPELFSILMRLFAEHCAGGDCSPDATCKAWKDIQNMDLADRFWEEMTRSFGYNEDKPSIFTLLARLFVTDLANKCRAPLPDGISHFVMCEDMQLRLNCSVFLAQWRSHVAEFEHYNAVSNSLAEKLRISEMLGAMDTSDLMDVMTFRVVDERIIEEIRDTLVSGMNGGADSLLDTIQRRRDGHWANPRLGADAGTALFQATYAALKTAVELFQLRNRYDSGLSFPSATAMFKAYSRELFVFDQLYRTFSLHADDVEHGGKDVLKSLRQRVERCYGEWFLDELALVWDGFLSQDDGEGLLANWTLPEVTQQHRFYATYVQPQLAANPRNRVFVIISDGLRYEAAEELTRMINGTYRIQAKLEPMLGVLPSYTALGMAALLPHRELRYKRDDSGALMEDVLVDGQSCSGFENRKIILSKVEGTALRYEDLRAMTKEAAREQIKDHRVVYIYHDRIDSTGDKAVSELGTFRAVQQALKELGEVVRFIVNNLNANYVCVTADHGFLYEHSAPDRLDRSELKVAPQGAVKKSKRFVIGTALGQESNILRGSLKQTARMQDEEVAFWLPRGTNRFNFIGGSRYFHGGATLQEVMVPLVLVRQARGKEQERSRVSQVGVSLLGASKKIVTNIHRFEFIQTDQVSDRIKPRTLLLSIRDKDTLISNEEAVTFDSASSSLDDRKKSVKFTLKTGSYDKHKEYALVMRDAETNIEYDRITVFIDLAIARDF